MAICIGLACGLIWMPLHGHRKKTTQTSFIGELEDNSFSGSKGRSA